MYLEHFGMQKMPFSITPDTRFFYNYGSYQEALNVLLVAIRSGEGFIKITGEVGTGKTLLCRKVLNSLDERFFTAFITNPCLTPAGLRMAFADELGIQYARNMGQHRLLKQIMDRLIELNAAGRQVILLLDEAQALPDDSMEALRLLTNLETEKSKLLQVVLFGQPELDERLAQSQFRQLRQRVTFSYELYSIDRDGLAGYLSHRLLVAGYHGKPLFTTNGLEALYRVSRGVPRLINILAHKTLMIAYGRGCSRILKEHIRLAAADTEGVLAESSPTLARVGFALAAMSAAAVAAFHVGGAG